jgi:ABC-2 type transport system permease protein
MTGAAALAGLRYAQLRNLVRFFGWQSKFKTAVLIASCALFWTGLYFFFSIGLDFLRGRVGAELFREFVGSILHFFFFMLMVMLLISNGIICYSAFYRSRETGFLLGAPLRTESVFLYKFLESLGFSSWAMLFLATPLMAAYGAAFDVHWSFYALSVLFFVAFMWLPATVGAWAAMLLTNYLPNLRRWLIALSVLAGFVLFVVVGAKVLEFRARQTAEIRLVVDIFDQIGWTSHPMLPSTWMAKGILELSEGRGGRAMFFFGVIAANAAFALAVLYAASGGLLRNGWFASHGLRRARRVRASPVDAVVRGALGFLPVEMRQLVSKDIKSFVRDPVQWSQFLIFFGLLAIYFVNLRQFGYDERDELGKILVSQMNLLATALTLSTFVSRFVFPQLSLEGRRFWVLGTAPMNRETILYGKMAFSFACALAISQTLLAISSVMLKVPLVTALTQAVVMLGICLGLSGMAVGLGAIYPNFREDNPSKIVSGFGGTLNLVCNLAFVLGCVAIQAIPFAMYGARMMNVSMGPDDFKRALALAVAGVAALSLAACLIPMSLGLRALRKLEI